MGEEIPLLPETQPTDDEDVAWGLQTAAALWARGERKEALVWVRRAAEAATAAGDDARALELTKRGAALEQSVLRAEATASSVGAASQPQLLSQAQSQTQPRPLISFPEPGERTPPIPTTAPSSVVPPASRTIPMHGGPPLSARHFDDEPTSDYDGELEQIDDRVSLPLLEDDAIKEEGEELTVPRLDIIKMQKALDERAAAGPKSSAVPQLPNAPPAPPQAPPLTQTQPMAHVLAAAANAAAANTAAANTAAANAAAANTAASGGAPAAHASAMQMQPPIVIESSHDAGPASGRGFGPTSGPASAPQAMTQQGGVGPQSVGPQSAGPHSAGPQSQGPTSTRAATKAPPPPPPRGRTPTLQPGASGAILPATPIAPPVAPGPPSAAAPTTSGAAGTQPTHQSQAPSAAAPAQNQQAPAGTSPTGTPPEARSPDAGSPDASGSPEVRSPEARSPEARSPEARSPDASGSPESRSPEAKSPAPPHVSAVPQAAELTPAPPAVAALAASVAANGSVELRSGPAQKKKGRAPILDPWADDFPIDDPPPNNLRASHHALDMGLGSEDDVVTSAAPLETTLRRKPPPPPVRPKAPAPGTILADTPPASTPDPASRPNGESQAPHRPPPPPPPPMRRSATLTGTPNPLWTPPTPTVAERKSAPPPAPASERKSVPPAPPAAQPFQAAQASQAPQPGQAPEHRKSIPPVEPHNAEATEAAPRSVSPRGERVSQLPPAPPAAPPAPVRAKTAPPPAAAAPAVPPAGTAAPTMPAGPAAQAEPAVPQAPSVRPPAAPPRPASTPPAARPKSAPPPAPEPPAAPAAAAPTPPATIPPAERSVAGLTLDRVEAFADLPGELQKVLAESATIVELGDNEEVKGFGTLLVVSGVVDVCATIADIAAAMIAEGGIVPSRTSIDDSVSLRAVAPSKAKVATWTRQAMEDALRTCPWVLEELVRVGDRFAALVGATMGPIGDLDDESRRQTLDRFRVRSLRAGEVLAEKGAENLGLVVVGAGALEVGDDDGALDSLNGGDLLYPNTVLDGSPLPHRVRAGDKGALLLVASRSTTVELFSMLPMLLELLRVA